MRQLNITSPAVQVLPNLGILTNVVELTQYHMIYLFRKIRERSIVELRREHNHVFDKNAVEVYFNGLKIGYVSPKVNTIVAKQMDKGNLVVAKVKSIKKQKFSPLSSLDIEVMVM